MSDNLPAPIMSSKASLLFPCAALILTVVAFGIGAPAKLAHLKAPAVLAGPEFDASIRYEPVILAEQDDLKLIGARRIFDELMSVQLVALR